MQKRATSQLQGLHITVITLMSGCIRIACSGLMVASLISSLYVCMVNIMLKYNFVETPRKFIIVSLLLR